MTEGSQKAILAAFGANFGIAVAKFTGFAFTGAASMLAEAVHSVAETSNQGLLLLGGKRARRPATEQHPFGYGRERYFWSFVVAVVLFTAGAGFALYEGEEKLRHPHELESAGWAVGILVVAIILEAFSLRTAERESAHVKGDQSWGMKSFLIGASAAPEKIRRIAGSIEGTDGVQCLVHLRTEHLGPDDLLVVARSPSTRRPGRRPPPPSSTGPRPPCGRRCPRPGSSSWSPTSNGQ